MLLPGGKSTDDLTVKLHLERMDLSQFLKLRASIHDAGPCVMLAWRVGSATSNKELADYLVYEYGLLPTAQWLEQTSEIALESASKIIRFPPLNCGDGPERVKEKTALQLAKDFLGLFEDDLTFLFNGSWVKLDTGYPKRGQFDEIPRGVEDAAAKNIFYIGEALVVLDREKMGILLDWDIC